MTTKSENSADPTSGPAATATEPEEQDEDRDEFLRTCARIYDVGYSGVVEGYLRSLITFYGYAHGALTPNFAKTELEEFKTNFEDAIETTRYMNAQFPKLVAAGAPPEQPAELAVIG
jgi:hypothetical protein